MKKSDNLQNLEDFIKTSTGAWFMEQLDYMRTRHYEKGEKDPVNATTELARASGVNEVKQWINTTVANPKGKQ